MLVTASRSESLPTIWRLAAGRVPPIVVMHDAPIERHVYCVHSVTGDVAGLNGFATSFGALRLHGIQVPKAGMTAHLAGTIETIARHHVTLLTAFQPRGPIHLIGWSAGAIIALEMARQLRVLGRDVPLLVALDGAPCNTGAGLTSRHPLYLLRLIANLPRWIRDERNSDWSPSGVARRLSEKRAARHGARVFANVDTLDGDTIEALIARPGWSPAQKAFVHTIYRAMAAYVPKRYEGRVLVFETGTQPLFHLRQIGASWRAIAAECEIVPVRGNHSGLILEPTAGRLAADIVRRIRATAADG